MIRILLFLFCFLLTACIEQRFVEQPRNEYTEALVIPFIVPHDERELLAGRLYAPVSWTQEEQEHFSSFFADHIIAKTPLPVRALPSNDWKETYAAHSVLKEGQFQFFLDLGKKHAVSLLIVPYVQEQVFAGNSEGDSRTQLVVDVYYIDCKNEKLYTRYLQRVDLDTALAKLPNNQQSTFFETIVQTMNKELGL